MICPHCGASVSETDIQCQYCNSYIDRKSSPQSSQGAGRQGPRQMFQVQGPDKPQAIFIVVSLMIPLFGVILGVLNISGGHPKSGRTYLIMAAVSFFLLFCGTFLFPMMFALIPFSKMM